MARVRFAPSPTGFIHLGGLRTAFVNFLYARKTGGQFIVRIEDTDRERIVNGSYEDIRDSLEWLGLRADEAPWLAGQYDTYVQSRRAKVYRESIEKLLSNGTAYRCFCTERRLEILRKEALRSGQVPRYDGRCRKLPSDESASLLSSKQPFTVRFAMNPGDDDLQKHAAGKQSEAVQRKVRFVDLVHGEVEFDATVGESDPILLKSDGFPVYHLANVVDDHAMRITTVLRGAEWLVSTPKHIRLYEAFGWQPPAFAHLPLLLTTDRRKLSKRDDAMRVAELRRAGFEPLAILNALARTCAIVSADDDETLLSVDQMVDRFELSHLRARSAILEPARIAKLNATLVQRAIRDANEHENARQALLERVRSALSQNAETEAGIRNLNDQYLLTMLTRLAHRVGRFSQLAAADFRYLFTHPTSEMLYSETALRTLAKLLSGSDFSEDSKARLLAVSNAICEQLLAHLKDQTCAAEFERLVGLNDHKNVTNLLRKFHSDTLRVQSDEKPSFACSMQILRHAMTGLRDGPSVGEMLCMFGYATACARLENAVRIFSANRTVQQCQAANSTVQKAAGQACAARD